MAIKPTIPKGTRDFSSEEIFKRNYLKNILVSTFEIFGYEPNHCHHHRCSFLLRAVAFLAKSAAPRGFAWHRQSAHNLPPSRYPLSTLQLSGWSVLVSSGHWLAKLGFTAPRQAHGFRQGEKSVVFGTRQNPVMAFTPAMSVPPGQYPPFGQILHCFPSKYWPAGQPSGQ